MPIFSNKQHEQISLRVNKKYFFTLQWSFVRVSWTDQQGHRQSLWDALVKRAQYSFKTLLFHAIGAATPDTVAQFTFHWFQKKKVRKKA